MDFHCQQSSNLCSDKRAFSSNCLRAQPAPVCNRISNTTTKTSKRNQGAIARWLTGLTSLSPGLPQCPWPKRAPTCFASRRMKKDWSADQARKITILRIGIGYWKREFTIRMYGCSPVQAFIFIYMLLQRNGIPFDAA